MPCLMFYAETQRHYCTTLLQSTGDHSMSPHTWFESGPIQQKLNLFRSYCTQNHHYNSALHHKTARCCVLTAQNDRKHGSTFNVFSIRESVKILVRFVRETEHNKCVKSVLHLSEQWLKHVLLETKLSKNH